MNAVNETSDRYDEGPLNALLEEFAQQQRDEIRTLAAARLLKGVSAHLTDKVVTGALVAEEASIKARDAIHEHVKGLALLPAGSVPPAPPRPANQVRVIGTTDVRAGMWVAFFSPRAGAAAGRVLSVEEGYVKLDPGHHHDKTRYRPWGFRFDDIIVLVEDAPEPDAPERRGEVIPREWIRIGDQVDFWEGDALQREGWIVQGKEYWGPWSDYGLDDAEFRLIHRPSTALPSEAGALVLVTHYVGAQFDEPVVCCFDPGQKVWRSLDGGWKFQPEAITGWRPARVVEDGA